MESKVTVDNNTWNRLFKLVPRLTVDAIILNEKGEVGLVRRDVEPEIGKWHFPGGYVRLNEKVHHAVRRKAEEETGLTVEVVDFFKFYDTAEGNRFFHPLGHVIALAYLCKPFGGEMKENAKFFAYSNKPKTIGFGHEDYLDDLHSSGFLRH